MIHADDTYDSYRWCFKRVAQHRCFSTQTLKLVELCNAAGKSKYAPTLSHTTPVSAVQTGTSNRKSYNAPLIQRLPVYCFPVPLQTLLLMAENWFEDILLFLDSPLFVLKG